MKAVQREKNMKNSDVERLKAQLNELVQENDDIEQEKARLQEKIKKQVGTIEELRNQVRDLEDQILQKEEDIQELEKVLQDKNAENSRLQQVAGKHLVSFHRTSNQHYFNWTVGRFFFEFCY